MEWLQANWEYVLIGFYTLEKVVKLSPSKKDDIVFDVVFDAIKKLYESIKKGKVMKTFKRIEINLAEKFQLDDIQEEKVLESSFMIVYIPFDERIGDAVTLQEVEDLLDSCGFSQDYLEEFDKESGDHSGYVKLVFREDDEEGLKAWMYHLGTASDYEEALRQERWF